MIQEPLGGRGGERQELHQPPECPEHHVSHLRRLCQDPSQAHSHQDPFWAQSRPILTDTESRDYPIFFSCDL